MTLLAKRINVYLSPSRRQAMYKIFLLLGTLVVAIVPTQSNLVAQWMALVTAVAVIGSLALAAIVTKAPQWPAIYAGMATLVAALVGASLVTQGVADMALRIVQAVITIAPLLVILARTDTSTPDGSPALETFQGDTSPGAPLVYPSVVANADHSITVDMADGTPPVTERP